jgi:hypothetical protein
MFRAIFFRVLLGMTTLNLNQGEMSLVFAANNASSTVSITS